MTEKIGKFLVPVPSSRCLHVQRVWYNSTYCAMLILLMYGLEIMRHEVICLHLKITLNSP